MQIESKWHFVHLIHFMHYIYFTRAKVYFSLAYQIQNRCLKQRSAERDIWHHQSWQTFLAELSAWKLMKNSEMNKQLSPNNSAI